METRILEQNSSYAPDKTLLMTARILLRGSDAFPLSLDLTLSLFVTLRVTQKTLGYSLGIAFQTTSKRGLDPVWLKISCLFFGWQDFLKTIFIQSGYVQKMHLGWMPEQGLVFLRVCVCGGRCILPGNLLAPS